MTPKEIIEFLYPDSPDDYVTYTQTVPGNSTIARLSQFVSRESLAFDPLLPKEEYEKQTSFRLWHLISSFQEDESEASLVRNLMEVAWVDEDTARKMSGIRFEDKYAHLSHKAIRKLLPSLLDGQKFATSYRYPDGESSPKDDFKLQGLLWSTLRKARRVRRLSCRL